MAITRLPPTPHVYMIKSDYPIGMATHITITHFRSNGFSFIPAGFPDYIGQASNVVSYNFSKPDFEIDIIIESNVQGSLTFVWVLDPPQDMKPANWSDLDEAHFTYK